MEEKELLQAIFSKVQGLEAEMKEFRRETNARFEKLEKDVGTLKEDMAVVKADGKHTLRKADILYDWVSGLDEQLQKLHKLHEKIFRSSTSDSAAK